MIRILIVNVAVSGVILWTAAQMMYVFISFNRHYASSSYPGDLTAAQEWMYLGGRHAAFRGASGSGNYI